MWRHGIGIVICLLAVIVAVVTDDYTQGNPLNGRHLRVLLLEYSTAVMTTRNATGHVISASGLLPVLLETVSKMLNFSYHFLPIRVSTFDDTPLGRGAASYILNNEADYLLTAIVGLSYRYKMVDFPASGYSSPFGTLVPYPKQNVNLSSIFKPLSYQVWITMIGSVVILPLFLRLLSKYNPPDKERQTGRRSTTSSDNTNWSLYYYYVLGNLLSQGNFFPSERITTRIAAGAWCCSCFFLVQIYCSTLTSNLTSPNTKSIIDSVFDIPKTPGITITLDKGLALDQTFKTTNSTFANAVVRLLKDDPSLRCNVTSDCLSKVKLGTSVYVSTPTGLKDVMAKDVQSTGVCHYTSLKETFWNNPIFTALAKKSPYTEYLSRAILRTKEAGFIEHWESWYSPKIDKCFQINTDKRLQRLSFTHLSSAFLLLGVGCFISLVVFLVEQVRFFFRGSPFMYNDGEI